MPRAILRSGVALAAVAALLCGCGGDEGDTTEAGGSPGAVSGPTKTFTNDDFDITFEYPAGLDVMDDVSFGATTGSSGPEASAGTKLGLEDFFAVQRFPLNPAVTDDNLEQFVPEADAVFGELAGEDVTAEVLEIGGLPPCATCSARPSRTAAPLGRRSCSTDGPSTCSPASRRRPTARRSTRRAMSRWRRSSRGSGAAATV